MFTTATELERHVDWLRRVESMHAAAAGEWLRSRLRRDADAASENLRLPTPWPTMSDEVGKMLRREAELVRLHKLVEMVPDGARILDVGCGPGVVAGTLALHRHLGEYLGVDLNAEKVGSARDMAHTNGFADTLRFELGDATELPTTTIDSLAPDTVLLLEILEHLQQPAQVLASIADLVSESAQIVFSVPLLGRLEACWGHRTLYGVDAVLGLAASAGLRLLDVHEVHNVWALATVTRQGATAPVHRHVEPALVRHVRADWMATEDVDGVEASVSPKPFKLDLVIPAGGVADVLAVTPGATWVRVDVGCRSPGGLSSVEVSTEDENGNQVVSWAIGRPAIDVRRRSFVCRPRDANVDAYITTGPGTKPTRTRLRFRAAPATDCEVVVWRLGFARPHAGLQPHRPDSIRKVTDPNGPAPMGDRLRCGIRQLGDWILTTRIGGHVKSLARPRLRRLRRVRERAERCWTRLRSHGLAHSIGSGRK